MTKTTSLLLLLFCGGTTNAAENPGVADAVKASPIRGGLCVVLGSADGDAARAIAQQGPFLVHLLADPRDERRVADLRRALPDESLAGRVTIETWRESVLPFVDQLVSLLVVVDPLGVPEAELLRVVRPGGELVVRDGAAWRRSIRPRPDGMDEWSQWRHGPDRNAVSKDRLVDVPERVQWLYSSTVVLEAADMVTANGRIFIQDRDTLRARDGFNGLPLWQTDLYAHKKLGLEKPPALIVAKGERVFALLKDGTFRALDAATGTPLYEFDDAGQPNVVLLLDDGTLVMATEEHVSAFDSSTGRRLWRETANLPHTLTAGGGAVYFLEGNDRRGSGSGDVTAVDARTGKLLWERNYEWARRSDLASFGEGHLVFEVRRPALWRELWKNNPEQEKADKFQLVVVDARTGEEKQKLYGVASSARHGEFCTAFWHRGSLLTEARTPKGLGIARYKPGDFSKPFEVFQANFAGDRGWGHCYPPVLTERFYLNGQLHFTDLEKRTQSSNVITRGACHVLRAGYVPANGLIYTFPKHCVCFPMLNGNSCLAPRSAEPVASHPIVVGQAVKFDSQDAAATDWPTFRHDEFRSGGTPAELPEKLDTLWSVTVPGPDYRAEPAAEWADNPWVAGPLSAPVVAGGLVYVAQSDAHRLLAFDAATGRPRWQFTAGGRLDGPPTIHRGLALAGCRDGWVYAVDARDGTLAWRRRIAPNDRRISTYGQLESAWPCAGSVLVSAGRAYVSAGLHPNAGGGVFVACLQPENGDLLWVQKFDDLGFDSPWPAPHDPRPTDKPNVASDPWRTIRPQEYRHFDLPVRDGDAIAVSRCAFDPQTGAKKLNKASGYYEVGTTGAKLPRTSWRYTDVQSRAPLAVGLGGNVFSTSPRKARLFRAEFVPGKPFDTDWVNVPFEQWKAGLSHASSKIFEGGARWSVALSGETASFPRALLVTPNRLLYAHPNGTLALHDTADGRERLQRSLEPLAWDALAATPGRVYATTRTGKLLCLGTR